MSYPQNGDRIVIIEFCDVISLYVLLCVAL